MDNSIKIDTFSRFTRVSRETINSLILYENLLLTANKKVNLIGKSTINDIWIRNFLDITKVIDLMKENVKRLVDEDLELDYQVCF